MDMGFNEVLKNMNNEILEKAKSMDKLNDFKDLDSPIVIILENSGRFDESELEKIKLEPNTTYEINGDTYETDDNGNIYKKNGELMPNTTYERNGYTYTTDENGSITSSGGEAKYEPEN